MEKVLKRLIAISLSLMLMFTMGFNVFAAETDPLNDVQAGEEAAAVDAVLAAIGELSNDPRDFTAADIERVEAIQADYEALSAEDQATVDSTFNHPSGDGQSYGRVLEAALWAVRSFATDTSTTLDDDTYTTTTDPAVSSESSKGKSDSSRVRNWWVESVVVKNGQATAYIYVTSGAATAKKLTSYPTVWTGGQSIERNADNNYPIPVDLNGTTYFGGVSSSMPRPIMYSLNTTLEEPVPIELEVTNNSKMFKAVSASLLDHKSGQDYLVMALSGTGYHELFKGTYEEAVANGDGSADVGNDSWIHGYQNAEGKWEFKIPVAADETYAPIVAVSDSYYQKYRNGENDLSRAFYPRQFTLDRENKTLVTDDFKESKNLEVINNVTRFSVSAAGLDMVGGPNSNDYSKTLALTMGGTSFDKMYVGRIAEAEKAETTIPLEENNIFRAKVMWIKTAAQPDTIESLIGEPFVASFHSVKNDQWYERWVTVNAEETNVQFDPVEYADYAAVDAAIAAVPENLDIYTPSTAQAVQDAVNAVYRYKFQTEQADVDAMAAAINDAVAALKEKVDFSDTITVEAIPAQTYSGKELKPDVTVKLGDDTLVKDKDFTIAYSDNTNAGTAAATITGIGDYAGTKKAEFTINPAPMKNATIGTIAAKTFTGKAQKPAPKVTFNGVTLKKDTDYKVAYKNNTNAGKATVTITGKGNFTGAKPATFVINPATQKLKVSAAAKTVKAKALKKKAQSTTKVAVSGAKGKVTYVKVAKGSSKKLTINKKTGKIKVAKKTKKGTYKIKVKVTAAKTKNYKAATVTKTIKVVVK